MAATIRRLESNQKTASKVQRLNNAPSIDKSVISKAQIIMLSDHNRMAAYHSAILGNQNVFRDAVVLVWILHYYELLGFMRAV